MAAIERHFVRIGSRHVHLRIAGDGPLLLLLHQSPKSSRELVPLIERWSSHFTCVAPDSPGYGLSDPLASSSDHIADYAQALADLLDALSADKALIYGVHTGAKIALAMGAYRPERVAALVANGVFINSADDRQDLANRYLPPFEIEDDGSHLTRLWSRMIDQRTFFPWYERSAAKRILIPLGTPQSLQDNTLAFLAAGANYRRGYAAALAINATAIIARQTRPAWITGGPSDILSTGLKKITVSPSVTVGHVTSDEELYDRALSFLIEHQSSAAAAISLPGGRDKARHPIALNLSAGTVTGYEAGDGRRVLLLPKPGGMVASLIPLIEDLAVSHRVIAIDPPGYGWSEGTGALEDIIQATKPDMVLAQGYSAFGFKSVPAVTTIAFDCPVPTPDAAQTLASQPALPFEPTLSGAHLSHAWIQAKFSRLYFPWFSTMPQSMINPDGELVAIAIHRDALALMLGHEAMLATYKSLPEKLELLRSGQVPVLQPDWARNHPNIDQSVGIGEGTMLDRLREHLS